MKSRVYLVLMLAALLLASTTALAQKTQGVAVESDSVALHHHRLVRMYR